MDNEEKLLQINEYYHYELEKALRIMYRLQEIELRYGVKIPKSIENDIYDFVDNFRFKYLNMD